MGKRIKDLSRAEIDGYLAVDNATNGTGKMNTSVIFNNFAEKFVENETETKIGKIYIHEGEQYVADSSYTGAWDASKFTKLPSCKIYESKRHYDSSDIVTGYRYGGSVGQVATKTAYSQSYAENGFVVIPVKAGEHVALKSVATSSAGHNFIVTDTSLVITYDSGYVNDTTKTFEYDVTADGYVICNSLPANFSFAGLYDEALIKQRMSSYFADKFAFNGSDLEIGWVYRNNPVTKVQPSSAYRENGCISIPVKVGDVLVVKGSPSTTDNVLLLTDTTSAVLTTYAKGTLDKLTEISVSADGFAYINTLPANFECTHILFAELKAIKSLENVDYYDSTNLTSGTRTYSASVNLGFSAPAESGSTYNKALAFSVNAGDLLVVTSQIQGSAAVLILADENNICRQIYTKQMVAAPIKVKYKGKALLSCKTGETFRVVHKRNSSPDLFFDKQKPFSLPQLAADGSAGTLFNAADMTTQDIYDALDAICTKYPYLLTSEILGKDASNTFDVKRYVFGKRTFLAWQRDNYPKMYCFKNGNTKFYSSHPSPRVGDSLYSTQYIGTPSLTVSSVSVSGWTLSDNNLYVRDPVSDVDPTLVFTMIGDGNHLYFSSGYYRNVSGTISDGVLTYDGNTYHRNHIYDSKAGEDYDYKMCIGCAEHGPTTDPRETAITLYNVIKNLCEDAVGSEFLTYIRNNVSITFIPVINPWGFDDGVNGRQNSNGVNINRNYNTPAWSSTQENPGAYPGSEIETQYAMDTFAARPWDCSFSVHCLGLGQEYILFLFGARSVDPAEDLSDQVNYCGFRIGVTAGDTPDVSCTSCAYQKYVGIPAAILIELTSGYDNGPNHTAEIITMDASFMLLAMWYLFYLKN